MKPSVEDRIAHILEYTKQKETIFQSYLNLIGIEYSLERKRKQEQKVFLLKKYKAKIYADGSPITVDILACEDVDAVLKTLKILEELDGTGYELRKKKLCLWLFVKDVFPDCGLIYAHGFDRNRINHTRESKQLQKLLSTMNCTESKKQ